MIKNNNMFIEIVIYNVYMLVCGLMVKMLLCFVLFKEVDDIL